MFRWSRQHPWRVAAGAMVLAALLGVLGWLQLRRPRSEPVQVAAVEEPAEPTLPAATWLGLPAAPGRSTTDLCDLGTIPMKNGIPQIPAEIQAAARAVLAKLAASLKARPDDGDRALGLFLERDAAFAKCAADDTVCWRTASAEWAARLVRLATTTSSADAYALALGACRGFGNPAAPDCALLNDAQWARLEPDNAAPWLYVAASAARQHDDSGFEEAVRKASQAPYRDPHQDRVLAVLDSEALALQPGPVQLQLMMTLAPMRTMLLNPSVQPLLRYCGAADQPASRAGVCTDLAAMFIERGRGELDAYRGGRIAESVVGTDERLTALREQADAIQWEWSQWQRSFMQEWEQGAISCDMVQRFRRDVAAEARLGHSEFLKRALAEAGITTSEAAERWREEQRQAKAQSAQSAAPAR